MQREMRAPDEWPNGARARPDSNVSVLAAATAGPGTGPDTGPHTGPDTAPDNGPDTWPNTGHGRLRLGARVFPLDPVMARRHAVVGAEVAVTASLLGQLPVNPAAVIVVAPGVAAGSVVDALLPAAHGLLSRPDTETGPLTLGIASPDPVRSATAGTLSMYNLHLDALPEALVEAVAAARRCGLVTAHGNCVLLLQRFVPASASAVVHVRPARHVPVRIDGRWGLTEASSPADTFEVPAGGAIRATPAWKPYAQLAAHGGTHTVSVPANRRHRYALSRGTVRRLAALSRDAAVTAGRALTLDVALGAHAPVVLRCRPARG